MEYNELTPEEVREQIETAVDLVVGDDDSIISREEFHRRIENRYDVVVDDDERPFEYRDPNNEEGASVFVDLPMTICQQAIAQDKHPEDIIPDPEAYAERMNAVSEMVTAEFERQLDEEDDPFPLEFPPRE